MTARQIANRVKKIKELETQAFFIAKEIDALKAEIQFEMQDQEHLDACEFIVNWVNVVTNRLDVSRIKKELPDIYNKYVKETFSRRFSISVK